MEIGIVEVLSEIDMKYAGDVPRSFSIEYVKESGEIRNYKKCQKKTKNKFSGTASTGTSKFKYNIKENNVVLIHVLDDYQMRSLKIPQIIRFNKMDVRH